MFAFLLSLLTTLLSPVGMAAAPSSPPAAQAAATAPFAWLDGTWRTDALEMRCRATSNGMACREDGRGAAMKGARADLAIAPASAGGGSRLTVVLPSIPPSVFAEVARGTQSVTYEMKSRLGVARLRFTRDGDTLTVERGNADVWGTTMTYRRG